MPDGCVRSGLYLCVKAGLESAHALNNSVQPYSSFGVGIRALVRVASVCQGRPCAGTRPEQLGEASFGWISELLCAFSSEVFFWIIV